MIPLYLFVAALFGWIERQQQDVIEFLREENRVLKRVVSENSRLVLA